MSILFPRTRKPRQFDHQPIYYDSRKEALEKRIHKVKMDLGVEETDNELRKEAIRGSFVEGTTHLKRSKERGDEITDRASRNMRLLVFIIIGLVLFWYFFLK